jgi:two-component system cell cycle response regulator DivK
MSDNSPERKEASRTVLVVDDMSDNLILISLSLQDMGYRVVTASNGADALGVAKLARPDLILMDIQLPEVSGLEVTKWLKEDDSLKAIPVVAVTAFAMKGDEEVIRQGGCEAYISKPISVTSFLDTVRRFIG